MKLLLPDAPAKLLAELNAAGFSAYVVGGCVRDALRGIAPSDWDICTAATPQEVAACFAGQRVVPTGLAHGTVTLVRGGVPYEITTYRTDGDYVDHRHPRSVAFTRSLREDLARRDFTVNAMAFSPQQGLVDPFGGQSDLAAGILRCVGKPAQRFEEDALRILRGLRFSSVLGFSLEPLTAAAAHRQKDTLRSISAERIYSELTKLLCGAFVGNVLREYPDVLAVVLPFITAAVGFEQHSPYHDKDVWQHIAAAVEASQPDPLVRWALLLHDAAKPACFERGRDGIGHFHGHGSLGAVTARDTLTALRADRDTRERVEKLVRWHDVPLEGTARCAARWLRRLGEEDLRRLLEIKRCDALAHTRAAATARAGEAAAFERYLNEAIAVGQCLTLSQLAVSGRDLLAHGIPEGPAVGSVLRRLLNEVLCGTLPNERRALLARAEQLWRSETS